MKKTAYRVHYQYNGRGSCLVEAKNEFEAESKFFDGAFFSDTDDGHDYEIIKLEKTLIN